MRTATESNTKTKRPSGASMLLIAVLDRFVILIKVNTLQPYTDISSIIINNMLSYICIVPLLQVPTFNVANVDHGATVLEGVSRNRNALIDGNIRMYDWNSGYTCHQLGNGAIVVQLAQPFLLRSMRYICKLSVVMFV